MAVVSGGKIVYGKHVRGYASAAMRFKVNKAIHLFLAAALAMLLPATVRAGMSVRITLTE